MLSEDGRMKICRKCKIELPSDSFHKSKSNKDKLQSYCKSCSLERSNQYKKSEKGMKYYQDKEYLKRQLVHKRKYKKSEKGKLSAKVYYENNKIKCNARSKLGRSVVSGYLNKPSICDNCGIDSKLEAHHDDYSKPLDVLWVCKECHIKLHRGEAK